jgi:hypothetical protein
MAHQVVLDWTDSVDAGSSYNVFRSSVSGSFTGAPLNSSPLAPGVATYTDTTVVPGVWYYSVESVENGVSSAPATQVTVSLPPAPPTGLTVVSFS